jgi:hypothetical protein
MFVQVTSLGGVPYSGVQTWLFSIAKRSVTALVIEIVWGCL